MLSSIDAVLMLLRCRSNNRSSSDMPGISMPLIRILHLKASRGVRNAATTPMISCGSMPLFFGGRNIFLLTIK